METATNKMIQGKHTDFIAYIKKRGHIIRDRRDFKISLDNFLHWNMRDWYQKNICQCQFEKLRGRLNKMTAYKRMGILTNV